MVRPARQGPGWRRTTGNRIYRDRCRLRVDARQYRTHSARAGQPGSRRDDTAPRLFLLRLMGRGCQRADRCLWQGPGPRARREGACDRALGRQVEARGATEHLPLRHSEHPQRQPRLRRRGLRTAPGRAGPAMEIRRLPGQELPAHRAAARGGHQLLPGCSPHRARAGSAFGAHRGRL